MKHILFFIFTSISFYSVSQAITIGTGTAINGITTASPVNISSRRQVSHTVYTVAELNAAGFTGAGTINQIGYFIKNIPIYNIPGYTIQMKHTTNANAGGNLNGGYNTVKNAFTYSPGQGNWDMIPLDNPFLWNGIENIVIRVCWSQVQPAGDPSGQLRIFNATRGYKYIRDNNGGSIFFDHQTFFGQFDYAYLESNVWEEGIDFHFTHGSIKVTLPPAFLKNQPAKVVIYDGKKNEYIQPSFDWTWAFKNQSKNFINSIIENKINICDARHSIKDLEIIENIWKLSS